MVHGTIDRRLGQREVQVGVQVSHGGRGTQNKIHRLLAVETPPSERLAAPTHEQQRLGTKIAPTNGIFTVHRVVSLGFVTFAVEDSPVPLPGIGQGGNLIAQGQCTGSYGDL